MKIIFLYFFINKKIIKKNINLIFFKQIYFLNYLKTKVAVLPRKLES